MVEGGQQTTSIETYLQTGSELFDQEPKRALAAYFQAVSLDSKHVEGWNQIGRLMFDLQQYSEAEMVFSRVEQLSREQGLQDWAEMAAQNVELTRQTQATLKQDESIQADVVQNDPTPPEQRSEPQITFDEETKSIEDISNIAAVVQAPAVAVDAQITPEIAVNAASVAPQVEVGPAPVAVAVAPPPVAAAIAQGVPPQMNAAPVVEQSVPVQDVPMASAPVEVAILEALTQKSDPVPRVEEPGERFALPVPPMKVTLPAAPTPVPYGEQPSTGGFAPSAQISSQLPNMPIPENSSSMPPPVPPQMPMPVQADATANVQQPSMVPPTMDAEMDTPKSSSGKIALMITGVVGAIGIGIGAAQYINTRSEPENSVLVIKSEDKLVEKVVTKTMELPIEPEIIAPQITGRDQAYKIGMTHLVKGDFTEARKYLEQAEASGHAEAGYNLASLYAKGDGVEQSFEKAAFYLQKSVDGGYYPAMTNLGLLYAQGQGVAQNFDTARDLWLKAAAGEHADAMHNLAVIYATGKGVDKNMPEAIKWYRKGANAGYVDSLANLGLIYANGDGVTRDYGEAKRLWEAAAAKGHKVAIQNLVKLKQVMQ